MRLALLGVLASCAFTPGRASQSTPPADSPGEPPADARPRDAAPLPPDACSDSDGDGTCDIVDTWPCGTAPNAPGNTLAMTANGGATNFALTSIAFDAGSSLIVVARGAAIPYHYDWKITDTACGGNCIDQLEIGFVAGRRVGCDVDQAISKGFGNTGHVDGSVTAPLTAGTYDLRTNIGQNFSCNYNGANNWWGGTPSSTRTIAKLCVH